MKLARRFTCSLILCAALLFGVNATTWAESGSVEGYVSGTQKELFSTTLADGNVAKRLRFHLTVVTDDPKNPIHLASQDCFATYIFSSDDKPVSGKGFCDGITVDGHVWWLTLELRPDGRVHWTNVGGVGKFSNLKGGGTTTIQAQFGDGKMIGRFVGTFSD